jgi:O-antigen/teichoic acid export membrane protein
MQIPTVWFIRRTAPDLPVGWRGFDLRLVRPVASFSSALFVTSIAGQIKAKTDELVIGAFLPVARVTPYALARRLSELPQILTSQFVRVLLPLASQLHAERDRTRLRALFTTSTRASLALFLAISCSVAVLAGPFLRAWVGPAYADKGNLVLILVAAGLLEISAWPAAAILQGMARHRLLAVFSIGSALANLGLSIALVRPLGITGVALGTLVATAAEMLFFVFPFALRIADVDARSAVRLVLVPTLVPAVPAIAALYAMREALAPRSLVSVALIGFAGGLVYLAAYLAFEASRPERETVRLAGLGLVGFLRARGSRAATALARRAS